jgi:hypothetical protein
MLQCQCLQSSDCPQLIGRQLNGVKLLCAHRLLLCHLPLTVLLLQVRVGERVYVCSTGSGDILELSYPDMNLVRAAAVEVLEIHTSEVLLSVRGQPSCTLRGRHGLVKAAYSR